MRNKTLGKKPVSLLASALGLAGLFLSAPAWATTAFPTPDGVSGTPQTETSGGATRDGGQCLVSSDSSSEEGAQLQKNSQLQLNEGEEPTFVAYVPQSTAEEASFTLQDQSENMIYQTKVPLPEEGGIISISLPKSLAELETGKNYKWLIEIHCTPEFSPENPVVQGSVQAI